MLVDFCLLLIIGIIYEITKLAVATGQFWTHVGQLTSQES